MAAAIACGSPLAAQTENDAFPLRPEVQRRLAELQTDWLDWLTAIQGGDESRADRAAEQLLDRLGEIGLERLPDLSVAASARAVSLAAAGLSDQAAQSLELAERLDPGRPETAFAGAAVDRRSGDWLGAAGGWVRGLARLFTLSATRYVLLTNVLLWLLATVALTALVFVGLQMATRGQLLYRDLSQALARSLPVPLAHLLTLAILLWPVLLPGGLLWVALFWSLLLWGYGTRVERVVMFALWLFLGGLPFLVSEQVRRMDLALSRPVLAVDGLSEGRLDGQVFSDLQVLTELLPESAAVKHLLADLHLRLRQWEEARVLYRQVLEVEPTRTAALSDLGIGLFYEGDLEGSISVLEDAVSRPDASAEAFFSLGRAYAEDLRFGEQAPMTQRASQMAPAEVREWLQADVSEKVISVGGGFERGEEIRNQLAEVWRAGQGDLSLIAPWRRVLSLPLALVFILPAIALNVVKRQARNRSRRIGVRWFDGEAETVRRALLPGIPETEEGRSLAGFGALLLVLMLATLAARTLVGYSSPLAFDPGLAALSWIPLSGLLAVLGLRFRRAWMRPKKD